MNTILPSLLIFPLFCSLLIPTAVLIWYMRWRTKEQGEAAQQIERLVATLSLTETMVNGLRNSQRRSSVEDVPQIIETPVVAERPHPPSTPSSSEPRLHGELSPPSRKLSVRDEPDRDVSPGAIEKAKALLKGGIPPVDVAKTLNMGLGEVSLLHRMITFIEHKEAVST